MACKENLVVVDHYSVPPRASRGLLGPLEGRSLTILSVFIASTDTAEFTSGCWATERVFSRLAGAGGANVTPLQETE
jgi:hypothetical protein